MRMIGCALGAVVVLVLIGAAGPRALGHRGRLPPP